jgi:hypothetical protein
MTFTLEPAAAFAQPLNKLIMEAASDPANEWFFYDGAHSGAGVLEQSMSNTWAPRKFCGRRRYQGNILIHRGPVAASDGHY